MDEEIEFLVECMIVMFVVIAVVGVGTYSIIVPLEVGEAHYPIESDEATHYIITYDPSGQHRYSTMESIPDDRVIIIETERGLVYPHYEMETWKIDLYRQTTGSEVYELLGERELHIKFDWKPVE